MSPRPARWKLPAFIALIAAAILIFAGVAMTIYEEHLYRAQQQKDVTEQANILAANVQAALVFDDRKATQEYVNAMQVNPELEAVGVYAASGRRVAQFSRTGSLPPHLNGPPAALESGHLDIVVPVTQDGAQIGSVYLRATVETAQRQFARYTVIALLLVMGALVLVVLGTSQRALTRANSELEQRALDLSELNSRLQAEMTEHQKTEEALRQSQKMEAIGQLSGGIAHDFNNLLMIAMGNLQLLRKRLVKDSPNSIRYIDSAEEGLRRAANLTQRLLAFARRQPLTPKPVNLSDLVQGMGELIRHSVGEHVQLSCGLEAKWWTLCDANQMENVILNLAINARDALPEGGMLQIETRDVSNASRPADAESFAPGDYVELRVRDNGMGMPEETRRRAVDPFFTTKPLGQGTGLGLSMTFGYIRQSGGYLSIESAPGAGATITILMPRYIERDTTERNA